MKVLDTVIETNDRTYRLIKRTNTKAFYKSDDGVMEIFKIEILPEQNIYGRDYPEREKYPRDEDFGKSAWCYSSSVELAEAKYESLP
jgi:hypothetical protein